MKKIVKNLICPTMSYACFRRYWPVFSIDLAVDFDQRTVYAAMIMRSILVGMGNENLRANFDIFLWIFLAVFCEVPNAY